MSKKPILHALGTALLVLASPAVGQVNDVTPSSPQVDTLKSVRQISAREWLIEAGSDLHSMSSARTDAIHRAVEQVAFDLEMPEGALEADFIEKALILDESYDETGYHSLLRVLSRLEDSDFAISQSRETSFESTAVPDAMRPAWVLVVPAVVRENGSWDIAQRNSTWASKWRIPFRDGVTQFVPATFDADDRKISEGAADFDVMSKHLKTRYGAAEILYAAQGAEGEVMISHWSADNGWMGTLSAGTGIDTGNVTGLRATVLDGFWSTFPSSMNRQPETMIDNTRLTAGTAGATRYRLVGAPRPNGDSLRGFIQIIAEETEELETIRQKLSRVSGLELVRLEDHGSSYFGEYTYAGTDRQALAQALTIHGFSSDLF
ncbi:hypothetical protein [Salipiger sp. PrR003]|uniref:hypothetical protein n=1 Tax=Salipiger sp. PrR003 TaxID=2706776 RepID=UPI0013DCC842|nr:hypothetical protein [Salipiger sp. PrR003]NDV52801.1 hypothetical protein [Salipiger sp. PrR003]